jgi:hypothetical protein
MSKSLEHQLSESLTLFKEVDASLKLINEGAPIPPEVARQLILKAAKVAGKGALGIIPFVGAAFDISTALDVVKFGHYYAGLSKQDRADFNTKVKQTAAYVFRHIPPEEAAATAAATQAAYAAHWKKVADDKQAATNKGTLAKQDHYVPKPLVTDPNDPGATIVNDTTPKRLTAVVDPANPAPSLQTVVNPAVKKPATTTPAVKPVKSALTSSSNNAFKAAIAEASNPDAKVIVPGIGQYDIRTLENSIRDALEQLCDIDGSEDSFRQAQYNLSTNVLQLKLDALVGAYDNVSSNMLQLSAPAK